MRAMPAAPTHSLNIPGVTREKASVNSKKFPMLDEYSEDSCVAKHLKYYIF